MKKTIVGPALPRIPWQDKRRDCNDVIWRFSGNPVVKRNPIPGVSRVFNSALIPYEGAFIGIFRGDRINGMPNLYVGHSLDGIRWNFEDTPIRFLNVDKTGAVPIRYGYDPRLVKIEDTYYITWCNFYHGPTIGIAETKDFKTFIQLENAYLPFNRNGVLFPRKINGEYVMLNRPSDNGHTPFGDIFLSRSPDMVFWGKHRLVLKASDQWWKSTKIGAGPIPIETTEGWLLIYHGVCNTCSGFVYSMGAALLDIEDPFKVIADCENFLLTPEEEYETVGFVPNVTFPCATVQDADTGRIAIFYGAADTYCAIAFAKVDEVIDYIRAHRA